MMKVKDITALIEELCPLSQAEDFDNVGLLVGDYDNQVTGILVALDCLEETIDEAIENECNLVMSFHPIIFKGLKKINGSDYVQRVVIKAIKNDISIYSMHTALDNSSEGVSAKMCEILGLKNRKILIPQKNKLKKLCTYAPEESADKIRTALFEAGAGHIGKYSHCSFNAEGQGTFMGDENSQPAIGSQGKLEEVKEILISVIFEDFNSTKILNALFEAHPYEEVAYDVISLDNENQHAGMGMVGEFEKELSPKNFLEHLKRTFDLKVIRHSGLGKKSIKKVAVLGGSGAFAIDAALRAGADAYVTADLKYHDFFKAENNIILTDIGHYESEQFTKNLLVDYLTKKITNFAPALPTGRIILSKINTNPINYF